MIIKVNIAELKNRLSEYLLQVEQGAEISVCKRNVPIARLSPLTEKIGMGASQKATLSSVKGWLDEEDPFFESIEQSRVTRRSMPRDPFAS